MIKEQNDHCIFKKNAVYYAYILYKIEYLQVWKAGNDKVVDTSHLDVKELVYYKSEPSKNIQNRPDKEELRGIFSKAVNG